MSKRVARNPTFKGKTRGNAAAQTRSPRIRLSGVPASSGRQQTSPPDDDIDAIQHEIHGMIEDAMDPIPARGGTNVQTE